MAVTSLPSPQRGGTRLRALRLWRVGLGRLSRFLDRYVFTSLTRRILLINLGGLLALLVGILYLNQLRAGLVDAKLQSMLTQGESMAAVLASNATVDRGNITIDPERLQDLEPGDAGDANDDQPIEFGINPERVGPVLRRLVEPTRLRARIYDKTGSLVLDSGFLFSRREPVRTGQPALPGKPGPVEQVWRQLRFFFAREDLPRYVELGATEGRGYLEVSQALGGLQASVVRVNQRGELILFVAVPIQRANAFIGALMLQTLGGEIDAIVDAERTAILRVFVVAAAVMIVLSLLMSGSIAGPVQRLAAAAERVRRGTRAREEIPDFTSRQDEIGDLSGALRDMTGALYDRIEAIERFAADVAHELKNPLTSLRSAVETLPLARKDGDRARLLEVIRHDVKRLDRLITDIADASRLDAEMQRERLDAVDLGQVLQAICDVQNDTRRRGAAKVTLSLQSHSLGKKAYTVQGHDSRLGQVFANLIDNAKSFSPEEGEVRVLARREGGVIEILVDDDGPGITVEPIERIFERFYTDRPETAFGNNSGLGLSISKQIVEAHRGAIVAQNRMAPEAEGNSGHRILGARFIVRLPAA